MRDECRNVGDGHVLARQPKIDRLVVMQGLPATSGPHFHAQDIRRVDLDAFSSRGVRMQQMRRSDLGMGPGLEFLSRQRAAVLI